MANRTRQLGALVELHGRKCWWCGCATRVLSRNQEPDEATRDHYLPALRAEPPRLGRDRFDELVLACLDCNAARSSKTPGAWVTTLVATGRAIRSPLEYARYPSRGFSIGRPLGTELDAVRRARESERTRLIVGGDLEVAYRQLAYLVADVAGALAALRVPARVVPGATAAVATGCAVLEARPAGPRATSGSLDVVEAAAARLFPYSSIPGVLGGTIPRGMTLRVPPIWTGTGPSVGPVPLSGYLVLEDSGDTTDSLAAAYSWNGRYYPDRDAALLAGGAATGRDEFDVGVLVEGRLTRIEWMGDTIEDDPARLARIAEGLGLVGLL